MQHYATVNVPLLQNSLPLVRLLQPTCPLIRLLPQQHCQEFEGAALHRHIVRGQQSGQQVLQLHCKVWQVLRPPGQQVHSCGLQLA